MLRDRIADPQSSKNQVLDSIKCTWQGLRFLADKHSLRRFMKIEIVNYLNVVEVGGKLVLLTADVLICVVLVAE